MIEFTPEQEAAINLPAQYLSVLACAGSGKTTVLTHRLARLISEGIARPENIAAITFTNLAADELLLRLADLVSDQKALSEMFVGTIHAFCLHLLKEFGGVAESELRVLTENQRFVLLNMHWNDWNIGDIDPAGNKADTLIKLSSTIDIIKMEQVSDEVLQERVPAIAHVVKSYETFLQENKYVDYASMLVGVYRRLESDDDFRNKVREKYQWLFVDEYQDVDPIQERIVRLLGTNHNLFIVGDDDQAIYQFRGTDVGNFLNFRNNYPEATQVILSENRRCRENILVIAKSIIEENKVRLEKKMISKKPGGSVTIRRFHSVADEAAYIVNEIRALREQNLIGSYSDVAILLRSVSSYGQLYIEALEKAGIPFISKGDRGMFRRDEIKRLMACLEFIAKEDELLKNLKLLEPVIGRVPDFGKEAESGFDRADSLAWKEWGFSSETYQFFIKLLEIRNRYLQGKFESLLDIVYDVIQLLELLSPHHQESVYYNTALFTQLVSEFDEIEKTKKLHRFLAFMVAYASKQTDEATPVGAIENSVHVLTIHQAKGLEFQAVFCPMLVAGRFPSSASGKRWLIPDDLFASDRYKTTINDERRLFYVATTRAKSYLYLTCASDVGLKKPVDPSEFLIKSEAILRSDDTFVDKVAFNTGKAEIPISTSYSSMEYYITCPYRYKLHRVYKFATLPNPFFEFGRVVHLVAALLHVRYMNGDPINDAVIEKLYRENFQMRYRVPYYVMEKRKRSGLRALKNYWLEHRDWFERSISTETSFAYFVEHAIIQGRIDLLLKSENGVEIIDFKTGHPSEALRRDFQMQTYSLAVNNQLGLNANRATLFYIERGEVESYEVNEDFLATGKSELVQVLDGIRSENFTPNPGQFCIRCEFRTICPHKS